MLQAAWHGEHFADDVVAAFADPDCAFRRYFGLSMIVVIAVFLAVCAAFYDAVVDIYKSRKPSDVGRTSCRFSPGLSYF